eukprot:scaffold1345_cov223-Pinguiococcus_pyrenoidosus.AAC.1
MVEKYQRELATMHFEGSPNQLYKQLVAKLLYFSRCTRPDLSYIVGVLARSFDRPTKTHMEAVKHAMLYVYKTRQLALVWLERCLVLILLEEGWCNTDDVGSPGTRVRMVDVLPVLNRRALGLGDAYVASEEILSLAGARQWRAFDSARNPWRRVSVQALNNKASDFAWSISPQLFKLPPLSSTTQSPQKRSLDIKRALTNQKTVNPSCGHPVSVLCRLQLPVQGLT